MPNTNNNSNGSEFYTPTTHSAFRFFNSNSKVDNIAMSFSFWNSLLKITMNPIIVQEGSNNKVDTNNNVTIYLSPAKAQYMLHCIREFRANPGKYANLGVPTNKGIIYIADGESVYNVPGTFIVINLINQETGEIESQAAYEINTELQGMANFKSSSEYEAYTAYSSSLELDMIEKLLDQFVNAYTNAVAASVIDCNKVSDNRMFNFIRDVREKLGITKQDSGSSKYGKSSWFSNGSSSSTSSDSVKPDKVEYDEVLNDIASLME